MTDKQRKPENAENPVGYKELLNAINLLADQIGIYGIRYEQSIFIEFGNGLWLRDCNGTIIAGGPNKIAKAILEHRKLTPRFNRAGKCGVSLRVGQVWRKAGPFSWLKIKEIMLPGTPGDDGGLPGISFDICGKNGKGKIGLGLFLPASSEKDVLRWLENSGRSLAS